MSISCMKTTPHRYDIVGSFLRPARLKQARADYEAGAITHEQLTAVEDDCIRQLVEKEKKAGLAVITDGEFRRAYWHLDFMWGFQGIKHIELDHGYFFHDEETTHGSIAVTGKIIGENHPFVEHYKFVKQFEDETCVAKQTLPAPAQFYAELYREDNAKITSQFYPDLEELIADIAAAYQQVFTDLYAAGCRNIQMDDCTWGMVCDKGFWDQMSGAGYDANELQELYLRLNNAVLTNLPEDLTVNTHVCRGNYHSTWASNGGYAPVAERLFAREHVDAFFLEFDDERSGGFEPLRYVPEDKKVVLGLVTTKHALLERREGIIERIYEAAKYIPLERLYLSPQCGFASCEIGNKLIEQEQWKKVALVKSIAEEVWG